MKRKWNHPEPSAEESARGRQYWRSQGELADTPEFRSWLEREFPRGAAEMSGDEATGASRRSFLKLMGAASALAGFGVAGCRRPEILLVPYTKSVEWIIPGKALLYASAMPRLGGATPLVVTTHEGRPTKLDGNRLHPESNGGSDVFAQASILDLYDPDRSKRFVADGEETDEAALDAHINGWKLLANIDGGAGTAFLLGESTSPTQTAMIARIRAKFPKAKFFQYEAVSLDAIRRATQTVFGEGVSQVPRFDRADRILSLNCDFLGTDILGGESAAQFGAKRRLSEGSTRMNRLYAVEPAFSVTGGKADHRYRLPASQVNKVAVLVADAVAELTGDAALAAAVKPLKGDINEAVFDGEWIRTCAEDLVEHRGKSIVVAGTRYTPDLHTLVALINAALNAFEGNAPVVDLLQTGEKPLPGIAALAKAIDAGNVSTLFVTTGADPVYDAPANLDFAGKYARVESTVHLGQRHNATALASSWHLPAKHCLEAWGDVQTAAGVYSATQPLIEMPYDGISELELFLKLLAPAAAEGGDAADAEAEVAAVPIPGAAPDPGPVHAAVRETFNGIAGGGDLDKRWNHTLRDGFLKGSKHARAANRAPDAAAAKAVIAKIKLVDLPYRDAMEVVFTTDTKVWDGRYINNAWLQELPDPITKLTWDNAALMSRKTAEALGIDGEGRMISVSVGGKDREFPVFIAPGHADYALSISLGYGQDATGHVGAGTGFNAYPLRRAGAGEFFVTGAKVSTLEETYELALTAEHYSMEGRALAREGTLERLEEEPDFAQSEGMDAHIPPNISLYKGPDFENPESPQNANWQPDPRHQWAMTIDLNSCTGCNACVVACQAENNIPVVGKEQVIAGREMHWIRMDRYFSSPNQTASDERGKKIVDDDTVEMLHQPVACVQCESAPCETVCPVNATVHSDDGLNTMAYNRCIGTRYCANNCPYKARRFNFFDYNKRPLDKLYQGPLAPTDGLAESSQRLQKNPNVTVRMRGVIEKCTYCVQRIQSAKIDAKRHAGPSKDVMVPTGAVKVACQEVCSAEAIVFGNLKDADDAIHKTRDDGRNYDLLKYIGTRPRTSFLAAIRNPNPKMPGAANVGRATADMH